MVLHPSGLRSTLAPIALQAYQQPEGVRGSPCLVHLSQGACGATQMGS